MDGLLVVVALIALMAAAFMALDLQRQRTENEQLRAENERLRRRYGLPLRQMG